MCNFLGKKISPSFSPFEKKGVTRFLLINKKKNLIMVAKEHQHQQLLANKLKQRWSETGSGPDVQKKLDAIKETLNARERLKRLEKSRERDDVSKSHSDQTNALKYLEKVKKDAKLDETDSSSLDMRKALPKEALEVARKDEDEIVSREDIEAENASNQLVDVFQKRIELRRTRD